MVNLNNFYKPKKKKIKVITFSGSQISGLLDYLKRFTCNIVYTDLP